MTTVSRPQKHRLAVLLGTLLFVAQTLAVAHVYQHELGAPVDAPCASCVIGGQLASGCDDNAGERAPAIDVDDHEVFEHLPFGNVSIQAAKQRGPPA